MNSANSTLATTIPELPAALLQWQSMEAEPSSAPQDGRLALCQQTLKYLRRALGLSQEQLAFSCSERGLCVSIASLKRAEIGRNVLYRTANALAQFYGVTVLELTSKVSLSEFERT